jgi:peptidoglycan hydrolase-like protein with peptidoglycan-binding domain
MKLGRSGLLIAAMAVALAACGGTDAADTTTSSTSSTIATTLSSSTSSSTTTTTVPATSSTVRISATSTTVRVQLDLEALGYFSGQVDGIAGEVTQAALRAFQTDQGITADGEFGPQTDGKLYPLLMADEAYVTELQEHLQDLGFYSGPIDGDYGDGTRSAVEKLQASCDLEETGEIDIATRICLDEA